jgi:transcriptional regulator with XRE-family HTH domain
MYSCRASAGMRCRRPMWTLWIAPWLSSWYSLAREICNCSAAWSTVSKSGIAAFHSYADRGWSPQSWHDYSYNPGRVDDNLDTPIRFILVRDDGPSAGLEDPEAAAGQAVREARKGNGWTQQRLADEMNTAYGYSWGQSTIGKIETSEPSQRRPLRVRELVHLAAVLGVPLGQLLVDPAAVARSPEELDQDIAETEAVLKEAERAYEKAHAMVHQAKVELVMREEDEREAVGVATFHRAMLDALRRAREQAVSR